MEVGAGAEIHEADAGGDGGEGEVDVGGDGAGLEEGVEGVEEREGDGLEGGVGAGEGGLEGVDVGEEGSEVVDGEDEVLVVGLADLLDLGLLGAGEVAEVVEEAVGLAGGEGPADEGAQVLVVADGGGEEELVLLVGGVAAVRGGGGHLAPRLGRGLHRRLLRLQRRV